MPAVELNGLEIYYETFGDPEHPPLLIIPGLGDPIAKCHWQSESLADKFYIIVLDNRGAGRSAQPPPGYTTADMSGDAAALLDYLDIHKANVFGFSLGGMIALNLALDRPDLVSRLALGCTTAGGSLSTLPDDRVTEAMINPQSSGDRYQDYLAGAWISCSPEFIEDNPETLDRLAGISIENNQTTEGYVGQVQAVLSHDVSDRVADLKMPTLIMHGDSDLLIPVENGRALAQAIPGAQFIEYPGAGHLFFIEQAGAVNNELRHFFSEAVPESQV